MPDPHDTPADDDALLTQYIATRTAVQHHHSMMREAELALFALVEDTQAILKRGSPRQVHVKGLGRFEIRNTVFGGINYTLVGPSDG